MYIIIFCILIIIFYNLYKNKKVSKIDIFDKIKIYYINLEKREDKLKFINEQIKKINCSNVEKFVGIQPNIEEAINYKSIMPKLFINNNSNKYNLNKFKGIVGCKKSHLSILENIVRKNEKFKYYIILEDDCFIENNFNDLLSKTLLFLEENKIDFTILYLGALINNQNNFEIINKNLLKCKKYKCWGAHAILYNSKYISAILKFLKNSFREIDQDLTLINDRYIINPMIGNQNGFISDINPNYENLSLQNNLSENNFFNNEDLKSMLNK